MSLKEVTTVSIQASEQGNAKSSSPTNVLHNPESPDAPSVDSTTCLLTPPSISINHLYVYNFNSPDGSSPNEIQTCEKKPGKFQSPAGSSGPFCRICHEGDGQEDLISPCRCTGSVGFVHLTCMERWLSMSNSDSCEICSYIFSTIRSPKSFTEWLRSTTSNADRRRNLTADGVCFCLLTPLAAVSTFLCVEGAKRQVFEGSSLEAGCLMALATFLISIYFIWDVLTFRYHLKSYLKWRSKNQTVKVMRVRRLSSSSQISTLRNTQLSVQETENRTDVAVQIPDPTAQSSSNRPQIVSNLSGMLVYPRVDFASPDFFQHLTVMLETTV